MPKFAANLSMMFNEVPFLDRFAAAAECGFRAVEYLFPQAYQGMGDPYMLPVITAVVIGGTAIMGGQGGYGGTIVGAIFITLLSSILSVLQMPEAFRQIVFGVIILSMLLIRGYKRSFR